MSESAPTAFITGASSGIGKAICLRLAADGYHLALAARRVELLEDLAANIRSKGGQAEVYPVDVADTVAVTESVRAADEALGGLDLVIANAGIGRQRWAGKTSFSDVESTLQVNIMGAAATLLAVLPKMVERGRGHVVGVSSLAGYRGLPKSAAYSGSKAFLRIFLEGLRIDLRGTGVAVTDVQPGFVRTPMTDDNKNPMPFLVEPEVAADQIARGIARRAAVITFPWQLATLVRSAQALPNGLWDRAVGKAGG
ncbi:MAG: SDR family NAD(P)-dependent oxidoreductase [Deltaproteobacteria bacterium]|nr:SDR family NAD(P)-dependent oxidoreductase [Deltaproteobacteria bacterium]